MRRTRRKYRDVPLAEIRIIPDTIVRQSLLKLVEARETKQIEDHLAELMASMKQVGQIEYIGLEQIDVNKALLEEDGLSAVYFLVWGYRRFLAAQYLGWETIKAAIL